MGRFRRLLNDLELKESTLVGRRHTWSNEKRSPTLEKLDRWFASVEWDGVHPNHLLQALSTLPSDHYCSFPILLAKVGWISGDSGNRLVSMISNRDPFLDLLYRLKATAKALSRWSQRVIGNVPE